MRGEKHDFLKNGSEIFFTEGLDRANQIEMARENRFLERESCKLSADTRGENRTDCSSKLKSDVSLDSANRRPNQ